MNPSLILWQLFELLAKCWSFFGVVALLYNNNLPIFIQNFLVLAKGNHIDLIAKSVIGLRNVGIGAEKQVVLFVLSHFHVKPNYS